MYHMKNKHVLHCTVKVWDWWVSYPGGGRDPHLSINRYRVPLATTKLLCSPIALGEVDQFRNYGLTYRSLEDWSSGSPQTRRQWRFENWLFSLAVGKWGRSSHLALLGIRWGELSMATDCRRKVPHGPANRKWWFISMLKSTNSELFFRDSQSCQRRKHLCNLLKMACHSFQSCN